MPAAVWATVRRRCAQVDELFGRLAEKPFEEFSEGERTLWQRIKAELRKLLDKFLGTLKLPKWFELGDNELRYILWRSAENLRRGKEHPIDLARDIVKRRELGLDGETRYAMGDAPDTFRARQQRAVREKGIVMPGLNDAEVKVVDVPRHNYDGRWSDAQKSAIRDAVEKYTEIVKDDKGRDIRVPKPQHYDNYGRTFSYGISKNCIKECVNTEQVGKSNENEVSSSTHLSLLNHLDRIIGSSIEVEEHLDRIKSKGERNNDIINPDTLMHRFYGVVRIDGRDFIVMTLMREDSRQHRNNGLYAYEVDNIKVLDDETPNTLTGVDTPNSELEGYPLAKVIENIGKTMEPGKNLLVESKKADEKGVTLYRPGETDDVWNDMSMGLDERITSAKVKLAELNGDDAAARDEAVRAIGGNLSSLRSAMSAQKKFDVATVKRVADLARVLIQSGHLDELSGGIFILAIVFTVF